MSDDDDEFARQGGPSVLVLNEEQFADFMYHMTHPKPPTPAMIEAAKRMQEWVKRPGDLEYDSWSFAAHDGESK